MSWRRILLIALFILLPLAAAGWGIWAYGLPPITFGRPWALLLLAGIPVTIWFSYRGLRCLGEFRCWTVLLLRSAIFTTLILALADIQIVKDEEGMTVLVLLDRSYSIPQEIEGGTSTGPEGTPVRVQRDLRWERLSSALRDATRQRSKRRDKVGVIVFGRRPRLEFPATELPELNVKDLSDAPDRNYTDIAGAIRLGLASFPEGTVRRILLITDGNENRGDALKEARNAALNKVPIDVVPLKYEYQNEILVDRIDAPTETLENRDLPIRIIIRNHSNRTVPGTLTLWRLAGEKELKAPLRATLTPGLNVLPLKWPAQLGQPAGSFSYRALFLPDNLPSDRPDNNEAWAPVIVRGEGRRVLLVVQDRDKPDYEPLRRALENAPAKDGPAGMRRKLEIDVWTPEQLPGEKDPRLPELSNYDCIFFYNIPADMVSHDKQEAIRKNTRDQGCGFVMIGGPDAFGAGRWQGEPLEEALPINTSIQSLKVQSKGGLVLIMHASEMAQGNFWQKEIARLAVNKLSGQDEVGVLYYEHLNGSHKWHVPLQQVGPNRSKILGLITSMQPGDMPQFDPSLRMAQKSLTDPEKGIGTKHIILVSDGDHGLLQDASILGSLIKDKITLTTVGVTTHGPAAQQALEAISRPTRGRHYAVTDPAQLPAIYIKETRVINQSFLYERPFQAQFTEERADPLREWTREFPPLFGYVRSQRKDSQLVQVLLRSPVPGDDLNPLLAQWQYGLGRVVAFTSDAGAGERSWARDWARDRDGVYTDFWARIMDWAMRNVDEAGLTLQSRHENGKVRVTLLDNRDRESRAKKPLAGLKLTLASPGQPEGKTANLDPVSAGVFEAVVDAEASGSYTATVSGMVGDQSGKGDKPLILARDAFAIPYSSEFAAVRSNEGLLEQIARETNGRLIDEQQLGTAEVFQHNDAPSRNLQPIWYWLVFLAACLLFFDVGLRRVAIEPESIWERIKTGWAHMRGKAKLSEESKSYIDRLRSRKATVTAEIDRSKAARRFEVREGAPAGEPVAATPSAMPPRTEKPKAPIEKPKLGADKEEDAADFATRLMRAKQKARKQIDEPRAEG